jgi:hypothetical protein
MELKKETRMVCDKGHSFEKCYFCYSVHIYTNGKIGKEKHHIYTHTTGEIIPCCERCWQCTKLNPDRIDKVIQKRTEFLTEVFDGFWKGYIDPAINKT